jgi:hypothetical protein
MTSRDGLHSSDDAEELERRAARHHPLLFGVEAAGGEHRSQPLDNRFLYDAGQSVPIRT